jgi:hypothetical protein
VFQKKGFVSTVPYQQNKKYKMTARLRRHKGIIILAIIVVLVLFGWLYRELHPTIVFHSPQESKYLGKVSGTDGSIEKLTLKAIQ